MKPPSILIHRIAPLLLVCLTGCDQLGIESASQTAARREGDGKAVGAACRHAARAIEDCYTLNRKADKAAMFAGWREMDDYMRENKLEPVAPVVPTSPPRAASASGDDGAHADAGADEDEEPATKPRAGKGGHKGGDKEG